MATTSAGSFPNVENLRTIDLGMTKNQVYPLIGAPHFHESVFRVRVWNYLFHFRSGNDTVTCEYQIQFDDSGRIARTRWDDPACERFAPAKIAADAETAGTTEKLQ
ncbi:outer membrane protein assembly factor BamE [Trinickia sp. NRRL B-1857]|uniref:outer membrane protein assembly factor BamE n=1 Tax=Trinickia sp. NRRL B-1857 TaxID=3162879 RepID=UPI003D2B246C